MEFSFLVSFFSSESKIEMNGEVHILHNLMPDCVRKNFEIKCRCLIYRFDGEMHGVTGMKANSAE
jgi:hypothetical protein